MKSWSIAYIVIGLAMLPDAYWGSSFIVATVLAVVAAGTWPVHNAMEVELFITSLAVIGAAVLCVSGGLLIARTGSIVFGIGLAVAGAASYWVFVAGRFLIVVSMGIHASVLFYIKPLTIGVAAAFGSVWLVAQRVVREQSR